MAKHRKLVEVSFFFVRNRVIGCLVLKWQCFIPVWSEEVSNQTRKVQHSSHPQTKRQRSIQQNTNNVKKEPSHSKMKKCPTQLFCLLGQWLPAFKLTTILTQEAPVSIERPTKPSPKLPQFPLCFCAKHGRSERLSQGIVAERSQGERDIVQHDLL